MKSFTSQILIKQDAKTKYKAIFIFLFGFLITSQAFGQNKKLADKYIDVYKNYLDVTCPVKKNNIKNFVYFSRDREAIINHPFLKIPQFEGAQIMYSWRQLEPQKGKYDFSIIKEDYDYLLSKGKKLFIQLQDATFSPEYNASPEYLLTAEYDGGSALQLDDNGKPDGWMAKRWNTKVQERFALLLKSLGKEFDGKIEGINLQETSAGTIKDPTFSPQVYTDGLKINMLSLKKAFPTSTTMQYANFIPGEWLPWDDKGYLRSIYQYGEEIGVGLGGPDLMIRKKAQLNHALALMHEGKYTVPLGIAVQDGNYIGETNNNKTVKNHKNIVPMLTAFADDFLKVNYMFWVNQEPYFTQDVIPCFSGTK